MSFQRARRDEQKAQRREDILATACQLCDEFGIMGWSLNELGRRAAITKSNLYRYFGSREEILLVLLHDQIEQFVSRFGEQVNHNSLTVPELCEVMVARYQAQPLLCDLLSVSATVLEQNTELEAIAKLKLANLGQHQQIAKSIAACQAQFNEPLAAQFAFSSGVIVAGLWPLASPQAPLRKLADFPGLEGLAFDFPAELSRMLEAQALGYLTKA